MTTDTSAKADGGIGVDRLFETGAHFAQVKSRRHPSMRPFVIGTKSKVEIFDLQKTDAQIAKAKAVMTALARDGKTVLFVGGKREVSDEVKAAAKRIGQPFVAGRWLGGTISNFVEIKKRIDRLADLTGKRESGELLKTTTKLERVFVDREITRLEDRLGGITNLAKRPDAMVIVDTKHEAHATKEAKDAGIPVIGVMSSDCDLKDAAFPIVVNDASRATVKLVIDELAAAFEAGQKA
jgi:small subunit ribosomal protein S2